MTCVDLYSAIVTKISNALKEVEDTACMQSKWSHTMLLSSLSSQV